MMGIVRRLLLAALMLAVTHAQVHAQSWPDRPIKFISSQAAGSGTDVVGRLVADRLSARVGQPIVFENRPGGGNVIGTQAAVRSAPDGYTFFFASAAALVTDPLWPRRVAHPRPVAASHNCAAPSSPAVRIVLPSSHSHGHRRGCSPHRP